MAPDVPPIGQLCLEVVRQRLQGRDVDLALSESPAFVGLVEVVAELPGPAGDSTEETLKAGLVALLLLLLFFVSRA